MPAMVVLGEIMRPHGVRGEVKLRSFTAAPHALAGFAPLSTDKGEALKIVSLRDAGDHFIARLDGVTTREAAERLKLSKICTPRESLPSDLAEDEVYAADLTGRPLMDQDGRVLGEVTGVQNFGGGDLLDVALTGGRSVFLPFTDDVVTAIDDSAIRIDAREGSVAAAFLAPVSREERS